MITRRRFLSTGGAMVAAAGLTGFYTWKIEPHWLEIVSRPLPIENLPPSWLDRTVVQISDLHVGQRVSDEYVRQTFRRVAALAPDLVVFTGDFIDYHPGVWDHVERIYPSFPKGRFGTVAILGNHDYGPAWRHPEIADRLVGQLGSLGLTILRNEV